MVMMLLRVMNKWVESCLGTNYDNQNESIQSIKTAVLSSTFSIQICI